MKKMPFIIIGAALALFTCDAFTGAQAGSPGISTAAPTVAGASSAVPSPAVTVPTALVLSASDAPANAVAASGPSEEEEAIAEASEPATEDPGEMVENMIREYLDNGRGKAVRKKVNRGGGWVGYALSEVSVGPENPDWAKHRVFAYEKALLKIEQKYIRTQHQTIKAKKISDVFKSGSDEIPDFKPIDVADNGKIGILIEKMLAVGEGKLDEMLAELGVDKEQFNKTPKPQRHTLISESLTKSTVIESVGSLAGMIPIQTFEGYTAAKEHAIGVICVASPKLKQFAYDILHNRGDLVPAGTKGANLYESLSRDDKTLIDQFGIRKMKDENGFPVLISFGQWANSKKSGDKRINRRYRDIAKKHAEKLAINQIALYLAGSSTYTSPSDIGEQFSMVGKVDSDNYKEIETTNRIIDSIREKSRSKANVSLSGLNQLYTWTEKHPQYGHEIVGTILKWSPVDEKMARKLRNWKPERKTGAVKKPKKLQGKAGSKVGEEYMDPNDW